jgi:predicted peroxiredoxin
MSDETAIRVIGEVEIAKLRLDAGDVLVVKMKGRLPQEAAQRIHETMARVVPAGVKCLVVDPSLDLAVMTRAEIETMVG